MIAIISRSTTSTFPEVGTSDRHIVALKTKTGIRLRARAYAGALNYRIEFFPYNDIYREPAWKETYNQTEVL